MLAKKRIVPELVDSRDLYRYSQGRVESSSRYMGWKNILVTHYVYESEYLDSSPQPATSDHTIVLLDKGCLKGQISYNQGPYRPCTLSKGEWFLGQANENGYDVYGNIKHGKRQLFATLIIHISPKLLSCITNDATGMDGDKIALKHQINVKDPLMTRMAYALKGQLYKNNLYGKIYAETVANLMAAHLLQNYCVNLRQLPVIKGRHSNRMRKVLDYIYENMHAEISIESLSELVHMSPYYFIKWFKKQFGETPYQYLVKCRMEKAQYLLKNTNKPVIEVALDTGYGYACNFSNAFKQYTGKTPVNYRKNC